MPIFLIVEGKNDRSRLRRLLTSDITILCTFGTLNTAKLESLHKQVKDQEVYLFMDNDSSGKKFAGLCATSFQMPNKSIPAGDMPALKELPTNT